MTEMLDRTIGFEIPEDESVNEAMLAESVPVAPTERTVPRIDTLADKQFFPSGYEAGPVKPIGLLDRFVDGTLLTENAGHDAAAPLDHASVPTHRADVAAFIVGFSAEKYGF